MNAFDIVGIILMVVGCLAVIKNKEVALYTHTVRRGHFSGFSTSTARQNIAIIGAILFVTGFCALVFF